MKSERETFKDRLQIYIVVSVSLDADTEVLIRSDRTLSQVERVKL